MPSGRLLSSIRTPLRDIETFLARSSSFPAKLPRIEHRMSLRITVAVLAIILVVALSVRSSAQAPPAARPLVGGEVLVKFRPGSNANARADAHRVAGGVQLAEIERTRVHRVRVAAGEELAAIARYQRNPNVLIAEPNYIRSIPTPLAPGDGSNAVPGDYYFGEQWALDNTGQSFFCIIPAFCFYRGIPDADIDAPEAWAISDGAGSIVTVAVIDTGIDYTHPDLAANYAGGYDFVFNDGDPLDDHGHGTHVAGTIAAAVGNLTGTPPRPEGVAGVAPHTRIRAYKVCRADGTCDDFAVQQAIALAITDGVNIINMSLGDTVFSQSLDDAVQDAWNAGLVIVAGAGNNGTTELFYPAASEHVISVAAFDEDHLRPSFSNYGTWVDIAAPGNGILSTFPMSECPSSTTAGDIGCYNWNTGTSMATPHVAGAAALVWSRNDVTSNAQVVDILLNSADGMGVSPVRLDSWTIHGGLNLHDAMTYGLGNLPPSADAGADQTLLDSDHDGAETVTLDGNASSDRDGSIVSFEWREGATSIGTAARVDVSLPVGVHTLTLEVTDDDGVSDADTVVVTVSPANQVTVTASTTQATEAGTVAGVFTVTRSGDTSLPLTVQYTLGGTALAGADYVSLPGTVTIEATSTTATVSVTPIDDVAYESNESVILTLVANAAYTIASPSTGTVTVVSNDLPPDLVVSAVSVPATAGVDVDLVVSHTTKNQGTGGSPASSTAFYLSANGGLDAADILLGSRPVSPLNPAATEMASTTVRIPASTVAGSYYVLAKADWENVVLENLETNNTRATAVVRIGPDLIVSVLTVPAAAAPGSTINVSETTKNQGGNSAEPSTTRFYLSTNSTLDASDVVVGTRAIPLLVADGVSATTTASITLPAAIAPGTYYVLAVADAANAIVESVENNNLRGSTGIRIGGDLQTTYVNAPAFGAAGGSISVTDTTVNYGSVAVAASSTGFYLSTNSTVDAADAFLGSRAIGELSAGATSTATTVLQMPAQVAPGNYYVIAVADWNGAVAETIESNNTRYDGMPVGGDLQVSSVSVSGGGVANGPLSVTDSTVNQGAPLPPSETGFYWSVNSTFDASDVFLGSRSVPALGTSATSTAMTPLTVPAGTPAGTYYVIAYADRSLALAESVENNNIRAYLVRVGSDLQVTSVTAPSSAAAGTTITVSDTTWNQGADTAPASGTAFYLSTNGTLDAADVLLGTRAVPSLAVNVSQSGSLSLLIPASTPAGSYIIIAKSDGNDSIAEVLENNNTRTRSISITASAP
jgi:subtilisin family serine protease/subtilase family serine protease